MSYYSTLEMDFRIREDRVEEFLTKVNAIRQQHDHPAILFFELLRLEDRWIEYTEWYANWDGFDEFATFLAPFTEEGYMRFVGQEDDRWGYYFDGDGEVYRLLYSEEVDDTPLSADQTPTTGSPGHRSIWRYLEFLTDDQ